MGQLGAHLLQREHSLPGEMWCCLLTRCGVLEFFEGLGLQLLPDLVLVLIDMLEHVLHQVAEMGLVFETRVSEFLCGPLSWDSFSQLGLNSRYRDTLNCMP